MVSTTGWKDDLEGLCQKAQDALELAGAWAFEHVLPDGEWSAECLSNATFTAEYVFLKQYLGISFEKDGEALKKWLLSDQTEDGSWTISPGIPGCPSTTTEAYLALKILGVPAENPAMLRAQNFMQRVGGVARVRNFTRLFLATFGLLPWAAVPQLPCELILMPSSSPINIYTLSSWARSTSIPVLIIRHHEPVFALPNGRSAENDFIDELWCEPRIKNIAYTKSLWGLVASRDVFGLAFTIADKAFYYVDSIIRHTPLRSYARTEIVHWLLEHQESAGDWAGFLPPMWGSVIALVLEGFKMEDSCVKRGLEAIERLVAEDEGGKRIQATVSPVWDTVLMGIALCDSGIFVDDKRLQKAIDWVKPLQLLGPEGDWRVYQPRLAPGGWSFEYFNKWYPDVDDTACAIMCLIKQDSPFVGSLSIYRAAEWILGMQNLDGGWAAFDYNNNNLFLNKIPFSDMNSLCDPSTADVTGRIVECFGLILTSPHRKGVEESLLNRLRVSAMRGITYLEAEQQKFGGWWGRWGCNYVYGTSNVLCGLATFAKTSQSLQRSISRGVEWLKSVQNEDGGWGETVESYADASLAGIGHTTPSQTAWGVMALLAHLPPTDKAIIKGVAWLVSHQTGMSKEGATWPEKYFTGTGFPLCLYLEYSYYPHYFPMMALGRFVKAWEDDRYAR